MNEFQQSCRRLLVKWCEHKAKEERKSIGRCRTAYKQPDLAHLTNRYADTLEAAAKLFDDLAKELAASAVLSTGETVKERQATNSE